MSTSPASPSPDDLQFETVEPVDASSSGSPTAQPCALCGQPITSTYYAVGENMLCPTCAQRASAPPAGGGLVRFIKAGFLGTLAGLAGALVWFLIRRAAGIQLGIVAVVVGLAVGGAVRRGSEGRGGLAYQFLAVLVTYVCIAANYFPDLLSEALDTRNQMGEVRVVNAEADDPQSVARRKRAVKAINKRLEARKEGAEGDGADVAAEGEQPAVTEEEPATPADAVAEADAARANAENDVPLAHIEADPFEGPPDALEMSIIVVICLLVALAFPLLTAAQNPIGLLIICFALWEAWKINAYRPLPISGPYHLGATPTA